MDNSMGKRLNLCSEKRKEENCQEKEIIISVY